MNKKICSLLLFIAMIATLCLSLTACNNQPFFVKNAPTGGTTSAQPFATGTGGSSCFRIPALATLGDGRLISAVDARWDTYKDGYGLDTIVSYSDDGGTNWTYSFANYLGDYGDCSTKRSSAFIDPCFAVTHSGVIYMLVDLYPGGGMITNIKAGTGFNEDGNLLLWCKDCSAGNPKHYLKDGKIYHTDGTVIDDLSVDGKFNLTGVYDGQTCNTNLFFYESPYRVLKTSYLYLTRSDDNGVTWSNPVILNDQVKREDEKFFGVGPGRGIVTASGRIIFPCYTHSGTYERTSVIYSDDGITWHRSEKMNSSSSEATIVETTLDGKSVLYMFTRHGGYYLSYDEGATWSKKNKTGIEYNAGCQINALVYSKKINGKSVILLSAPANKNKRKEGVIFYGTAERNGIISWLGQYEIPGTKDFFAYSCLSEMPDGKIAVLYESGNTEVTFKILENFQIL